MRKAMIIGLALLCVGALSAQKALAAAPVLRQGCVINGWVVSGGTNTPFSGVIQESSVLQTATTGSVLSGKEVVNVGGLEVCAYTVDGTLTNPFTINPDGSGSEVVNYKPAAGNPAGCIPVPFIAHSQNVGTTTANHFVATDPGFTAAGTCTYQ
jgi:hypothetical protein